MAKPPCFAEAFAPAKETVGRQGLRLCRVPRLAVPARLDEGSAMSAQSTQKPVCAVVDVGPGNGAAFARRFAAEGYAVALLARTTSLTSRLAQELPLARAYACDAGDPATVERTFEAIESDLGSVDVLIYNAGKGVWGSAEEVTFEDFEAAWRTNTLAPSPPRAASSLR